MEVHLGHFKYNFLYETMIGTSTVSLTTLEQSKLYITYSIFLILMYVIEAALNVYSWFSTGSMPMSMLMTKGILVSFGVYSLLKGIWDHKSNISAALNLVAIEEKLVLNNIEVTGKGLFKKMIKCAMVMHGLMHVLSLVYNVYQEHDPPSSYIRYVTSIQTAGTVSSFMSASTMYLITIFTIQKAITKGFSEVGENELEMSSSRPSTSRRRQRGYYGSRINSPNTEMGNKWMFLTEIQGSLANTENNVSSNICVHMILYRVMVEVFTPVVLMKAYLDGQTGIFVIFCSLNIAHFIIIVLAVESVRKEKEEAFYQLSGRWKGSKRCRHQLLANIHRRRRPFSCVLFDIDYTLLTVMLENSMFVVTSLLAYQKGY